MIEMKIRKVWFSPAKGRHFLTRRSAIRAEANAKIFDRYPTEQSESENGRQYYPGYHFPSDEPEKYNKMLRRLMRIIEKNTAK